MISKRQGQRFTELSILAFKTADAVSGRLQCPEERSVRSALAVRHVRSGIRRAPPSPEPLDLRTNVVLGVEPRARDPGFRQLGAARHAARAEAMLSRLAGTGPAMPGGPLRELTRREREVLALVADGLTNHEIAQRLVVSEHTVHRHVTNILRKLGLPTRAAAASLAVRQGLA